MIEGLVLFLLFAERIGYITTMYPVLKRPEGETRLVILLHYIGLLCGAGCMLGQPLLVLGIALYIVLFLLELHLVS